MSNQIGTTPIPPELGTTITGAINNLYTGDEGEWVYAGEGGGTTTVTITTDYGFKNITGVYVLFINSSRMVLDSKVFADKFSVETMASMAGGTYSEAAISLVYGPNYYGQAWVGVNQIRVYTSVAGFTLRVYVKTLN